MATEVITARWCDVCLTRDGKREPSVRDSPVMVAVSDPEAEPVGRELDLCTTHSAELDAILAPLLTMLDAYGQPLADAPRKRGRPRKPATVLALAPPPGEPWPCPLCGQQYPGRSAVVSHLKGPHHLTPLEAAELLPRGAGGPAPGAFPCPVCPTVSTTKQGRSAHMRANHPDDPLPE